MSHPCVGLKFVEIMKSDFWAEILGIIANVLTVVIVSIILAAIAITITEWINKRRKNHESG